MMTQEFALTIGVIPGYHHDNQVNDALKLATEVWHQIASQVNNETNIYVSAVFHQTVTVYPTEYGCPLGGEKTIQVTGLRNPKYHTNEIEWRRAVREICKRVKLALCQSTAYLSFRDVDFEYMQ